MLGTKCVVVNCVTDIHDAAASPSILTVKQHEIVTLEPGACAIIVYRGQFEVINPKERKFEPLPNDFTLTQPQLIMGVDAMNEAVVFHRAAPFPSSSSSSSAMSQKLICDETTVTSNSASSSLTQVQVQKPSPTYLAHTEFLNDKKRKLITTETLRAKYAEKLLTKLTRELLNATLTIPVDGKEYSAPIVSVSFNKHGSVLLCVGAENGMRNATVNDWLQFLGFQRGPLKSDQLWWPRAHIQRPGGPRVLLQTVVPWELKTFTNEDAILNYLDRDWAPHLTTMP